MYIVLSVTFGYTMIVAETALGRNTAMLKTRAALAKIADVADAGVGK